MKQSPRPRAAPRQPADFFCRAGALALVIVGSVALFCLPASAAGASATSKRAAAKAQFERAEKFRTALQGRPEKERGVEEYRHLVTSYRRVYLITPHAAQVPAALRTIAELYQEMGRLFDTRYYQSAIDAYQFLLHEYPASRYRQDALLTIGRIQKDDLDQPDVAEKTFQEFLRLHRRSPKVQDVKEALAEIASEREQKKQPGTRAQVAEAHERERKLPQVTQIRSWNAESYTRVVIDLENQVNYQSARISNPDRIYFDLYQAKLSSTLAGKTFEVASGFLKNIRVAQNKIGIVRVVLDVEKVQSYSAFLLPNPYRLVVDVYGPPPARAATRAGSEGTSAASGAQKVEPGPTQKPSARSEGPPTTDTELARQESPKQAPAPGEKPGRGKPAQSAREAAAAMAPPPVPQPNHDGQRSLTRALGLKIGRIVVDPGHGGQDTGTIGPSGLMEKDLCLDIALRLGKLIEQRLPGAEVIYTREDDTFVPLENRTAMANQIKADLFISIHANSSRDRKARGVETYYLNFAASPEAMEVAARENALSQGSIHELQDLIKKIANNEKIEESREFAMDIHEALTQRLQRVSSAFKSRGVRKAPFVVLIGANMPSVLSEISFISNPADERLLKKPETRQRVAEGLYHGVESYLQSLNSLTYNPAKTSSGSH